MESKALKYIENLKDNVANHEDYLINISNIGKLEDLIKKDFENKDEEIATTLSNANSDINNLKKDCENYRKDYDSLKDNYGKLKQAYKTAFQKLQAIEYFIKTIFDF